jgi:thymidylate synthase
MTQEGASGGRIPSFHVVAESIPEAFYKAMDAVWHHGMTIRTQYDRKDRQGNFIDPPSRDARVLIEIKDPFAQPRYPKVSFCEIGKYIAEVMGAKDHLVVPFEKLREGIRAGKVDSHWPYTYHQRLFSYPLPGGGTIDQIDRAIDRIVESPISRRAVATTRVPEVDAFLSEDLPCLGEVQLRCPRAEDGSFVLNMDTRWRSRDLYKAWCDNVIALTFLQQVIAGEIGRRTGVPTRVGSYADYATSLHIYGQDFAQIREDREKGIRNFFEKFTAESLRANSVRSDRARDALVVPQLEELLGEDEQWRFTATSRGIIEDLIDGLRSGRYLA